MESKHIQLGILIIGIISMFLTLIFKLWDKKVGGLISIAYTLIYLLFVLIGIIFLKVYGKNGKNNKGESTKKVNKKK